jgi:hypothetical protein
MFPAAVIAPVGSTVVPPLMLTVPAEDVSAPTPEYAPESVTTILPALLTAALNATFPPVVAKVKTFVGVELDTALLTVMAPVLLSVADPLPRRVSIEAGVTLEVPDELVYQVPFSHSPPASAVDVETVIAAGIPLVVTVSEKAVNPWEV